VLEAMRKLRPELNLIITLHYVDGYSIQEVASSLGIPESTVKTRMRSARKQLGRTLLVEWEAES
jgi:RNA polymerase sigma-70 factor (ECF subfamily)